MLVVDILQDCPNAPGVVFTKSEVGSPTGMARWWKAQMPSNTKRSTMIGIYLPGCASGASLLVVDLGAANHGLGSTNPLHSIVTLDELPLSLAASHILLLYIYIKFGMLLVRLRY